MLGASRQNIKGVKELFTTFSNSSPQKLETFNLNNLLHNVATDPNYTKTELKKVICKWLGIELDGRLIDQTPLEAETAFKIPIANPAEFSLDSLFGKKAPSAHKRPSIFSGNISGMISEHNTAPKSPRLVRGAKNLDEMLVLKTLETTGVRVSITPAFRFVQATLQAMKIELAKLDAFSSQLNQVQAQVIKYNDHCPAGEINGAKQILPGLIGYFKNGDKLGGQTDETCNLIVYDGKTGNGVFISITDNLPREAINAAVTYFIAQNPDVQGRLQASIIGPRAKFLSRPVFSNVDNLAADADPKMKQTRSFMEAVTACAVNNITICSAEVSNPNLPKHFCICAKENCPEFIIGRAKERAAYSSLFPALRKFTSEPYETNLAFDSTGNFAPYLTTKQQVQLILKIQKYVYKTETLMEFLATPDVPVEMIPIYARSLTELFDKHLSFMREAISKPCENVQCRVLHKQPDFDVSLVIGLMSLNTQILLGSGGRALNSLYPAAIEQCFVKGADGKHVVNIEPVIKTEAKIIREARKKFNVVELAAGRAVALRPAASETSLADSLVKKAASAARA